MCKVILYQLGYGEQCGHHKLHSSLGISMKLSSTLRFPSRSYTQALNRFSLRKGNQKRRHLEETEIQKLIELILPTIPQRGHCLQNTF